MCSMQSLWGGALQQLSKECIGYAYQGRIDPSDLWFEVSLVEDLHEDECDEQGDDEVDYGDRMVLVTVVQSPVIRESVEDLVFDIPSAMCDLAEGLCADEVFADGRGPVPL